MARMDKIAEQGYFIFKKHYLDVIESYILYGPNVLEVEFAGIEETLKEKFKILAEQNNTDAILELLDEKWLKSYKRVIQCDEDLIRALSVIDSNYITIKSVKDDHNLFTDEWSISISYLKKLYDAKIELNKKDNYNIIIVEHDNMAYIIQIAYFENKGFIRKIEKKSSEGLTIKL